MHTFNEQEYAMTPRSYKEIPLRGLSAVSYNYAMVDPLAVYMTGPETNCLVQVFSQKVSGEVYSLSSAFF